MHPSWCLHHSSYIHIAIALPAYRIDYAYLYIVSFTSPQSPSAKNPSDVFILTSFEGLDSFDAYYLYLHIRSTNSSSRCFDYGITPSSLHYSSSTFLLLLLVQACY